MGFLWFSPVLKHERCVRMMMSCLSEWAFLSEWDAVLICVFIVVSSGPVSGSEEEEGAWAADSDGVYSGLGRGGH